MGALAVALEPNYHRSNVRVHMSPILQTLCKTGVLSDGRPQFFTWVVHITIIYETVFSIKMEHRAVYFAQTCYSPTWRCQMQGRRADSEHSFEERHLKQCRRVRLRVCPIVSCVTSIAFGTAISIKFYSWGDACGLLCLVCFTGTII